MGTELLLGQIADTNSSWIGEQLALAGIDSHHQVKVGDNLERIRAVLDQALDRSDSIIMCGGLGPTQDDITSDAIAAALGVELVRRDEVAARISAVFASRGRAMPENNLRQADIPEGAEVLSVMPGTAPGFKAEAGGKAVYAVPGIPWEMQQMVSQCVLPDLKRRAGITSLIKSRTLRTWGDSESALAEKLHGEIKRLDQTGECTIAFLASGMEGLKVRLTAKAPSGALADEILADEERIVRAIIGDIVFGVDDETMEWAVLDALRQRGWTLALAESLTGGLIGARLTAVAGAGDVFRGGLVSYAGDVKFDLLEVPEGPVVSEEAVVAMARGAAELLAADCAIAVTGVAGPDPLDGEDPGTVWMATLVNGEVQATRAKFPFDRERIRQLTAVSVLNNLRIRVLAGK